MLAPGAAQANILGIDDFFAPFGISAENDLNRALGWSFSVDTSVTLKELGVWDDGGDGFGQAHQVGLWTEAGDLLGSTLVQAGTATPSQGPVVAGGLFRFAPVADIVLNVGETYVIGAFFNGDDQFVWDAGGMSTASQILFGQTRFGDVDSGFTFPDNNLPPEFAGRLGIVGPNFTFVPEPSTALLLGLGIIGLAKTRRRR
jgi:hypothetical protein